MSRPGNTTDLKLNGYSYTACSYAPREDGQQKMKLDNLNFTLDDFHKLSSGTYNAGQLTLDSKGKLDIINNHKTWTIFNNKEVNASTSFAIRSAFAKALESSGVSAEDMADVRKSLGLKADSSAQSHAAFTPLARQEVREIIDKYIGSINARRAASNETALKTDAQIHARYDDKELKDIKAARNKINSTGRGNVSIDKSLNEMLTLISSTEFSHFDKKELELQKTKAKDLLKTVEELKIKYRDGGAGAGATTFSEHIDNGLSLGIDNRTGKLLSVVVSGDSSLTFSLGQTPDEMVESINAQIGRIDAELDKFKARPLDTLFTGDGTKPVKDLITAFKNSLAAKDPNLNADIEFNKSIHKYTTAGITTTIAQQIGEKFDPDDEGTTFKLDIERLSSVYINGDRIPNGNFHNAREKMLRFVTGDDELTWDNATQAQKVKTNIILALCNQALNATPLNALSDTLNPNPKGDLCLTFVHEADSVDFSYSVSKNSYGDIVIKAQQALPTPCIVTNLAGEGMKMHMVDKARSRSKYEMEIILPSANLDKLANANWSKYDHKPVHDAGAGKNDNPEGHLNAAELIPQEFKFEGIVHVTQTAELYEPSKK